MLVNVVIVVFMKYLKEFKEKIVVNMVVKDLERKFKLLILLVKNFIKVKVKWSD